VLKTLWAELMVEGESSRRRQTRGGRRPERPIRWPS